MPSTLRSRSRPVVDRSGHRPISLAIVNDYPVVTAGLATLLRPYAHRVRIREFVGDLPPSGVADVVLYDPFGGPHAEARVRHIARVTRARVIVYSWATGERRVEAALRLGATAFLPKHADAAQILGAVEAVHADRAPELLGDTDAAELGVWPGQDQGLTVRESEMLAFIVTGLTNPQIASTAYLSINSVKTHVRTAYRKIRVTNRTQAVMWALDHGFKTSTSPGARRPEHATHRIHRDHRESV